MGDVKNFKFYMNYPVCGFCMSAWDIVFQRRRGGLPPQQWVNYCKVGGCDPEIWEYLDDDTGWPKGWKLRSNGWPDWKKLPKPPKANNDCYHRRDDDGVHAPWRKNSLKLLRQAQMKFEKQRNITDEQIRWDEEEEPEQAVSDDIEWD